MGVSDTSWIAGLLVIALFVSAVSTYTVVSRFGFTGLASVQQGTTTATVDQTVVLALPVNNVDFGNINVTQWNDTTDDSPPPFEVRNDGNVNINITVNATNLWSTKTTTSAFYQYKCGNKTGSANCSAGSKLTYTNMPVNAASDVAIYNLNWQTGNDTLRIDINITAPGDEPAGAKGSVVYFTGIQV